MVDAPTSRRTVELYEATEPQVKALLAALKPLADRHPQTAVPPATLVLAREVLAAVRRVLSRERGVRAALPAAGCLNADLVALLTLAHADLQNFRRGHEYWDDELGENMWDC